MADLIHNQASKLGRSAWSWPALSLYTFVGLVVEPVPAYAHEASGGFILLMPTEMYILGASLAVLASFLILAVLPAP